MFSLEKLLLWHLWDALEVLFVGIWIEMLEVPLVKMQLHWLSCAKVYLTIQESFLYQIGDINGFVHFAKVVVEIHIVNSKWRHLGNVFVGWHVLRPFEDYIYWIASLSIVSIVLVFDNYFGIKSDVPNIL